LYKEPSFELSSLGLLIHDISCGYYTIFFRTLKNPTCILRVKCVFKAKKKRKRKKKTHFTKLKKIEIFLWVSSTHMISPFSCG
jgi:hypothetical protein